MGCQPIPLRGVTEERDRHSDEREQSRHARHRDTQPVARVAVHDARVHVHRLVCIGERQLRRIARLGHHAIDRRHFRWSAPEAKPFLVGAADAATVVEGGHAHFAVSRRTQLFIFFRTFQRDFRAVAAVVRRAPVRRQRIANEAGRQFDHDVLHLFDAEDGF